MQEFAETLHPGYTQAFTVKRMLADERSEFQHIQLFDNPVFGRILVLDGIVQITERDEHTYSEMMVHPAMFEHGRVETVMIAGGGDGAVAEEVLKHASVQHVDLVEIDPRVVELARQFLPSVHGAAFSDPRLHLHFADASRFLDMHPRRYDLIISDRPDPVGPAERLFSESYYRKAAAALQEHGIAVFQSGVPFFQHDEYQDTCRKMRSVWGEVVTYLTVTPTYTGGLMAITRGSTQPLTAHDLDAAVERARAACPATRTYTPDVHRAAYALPAWIERLMKAPEGDPAASSPSTK